MNRLQKKCLIGTVGIHLLLLLILIVGPAFYNQEPKTDNTPTLDVIPDTIVDAAVNSGVQGAQPPPTPKPVTPQPPQPQPLFAPPKIVQPPTPAPTPPPTPAPAPAVTPSPSLMDKFREMFETKPAPEPAVKPDLTPTERKTQTQPHPDNIKIDLRNKVTRTQQKNQAQPDNAQNLKAINNELRSLKSNLSSATKIDMPGHNSAAYANYGDVVISIYHHAWAPPDGMASDNVTVIFKVTIAKDGTVISAHIVTPSGDPSINAAVQRMLDRVTFIAPFPEDSTDEQRSYPVEFNATRTTE
jgi:TonB family protein